MGAERDELAEALAASDGWPPEAFRVREYVRSQYRKYYDAVIAAGYRKPRTVTTAAELDALPVDSTVLDAKGFVYQKWVDLDEPDLPWWALVGDSRQYPARRITLPATVLHVGAQP